jgi:hypothetical protein
VLGHCPSLRLIDELIDRHDVISTRPKPFGTTTGDLATARLQRSLDGSLKSTASVRPDFNKKNRLIRCTGIYLLGNPLHSVVVCRFNFYAILTTALSISIDDTYALSHLFDF